MKFWQKILLFFFALSLLFSNLRLGLSHNEKPSKKLPYVEGELLVKFKKGTLSLTKSATHKFYKARVKERFEGLNLEHVKLEEGMTVEKALSLYKNDPDVEYAEPNYLVKKSVIPDDTYYNLQWAHPKIKSERTWDTITGNGSVIVAVIDTGIDYNHPDLKDNIWINSGENCSDALDNDNNGYINDCLGWNFVSNNNDPMDDDIDGKGSHGTHVAGIIGAIGNNNFGVAGVTWNVKLMALKVLGSDGLGRISNIIRAMEYAKDKGAKIINLSMEVESESEILSLKNALIDAKNNNILVVAAAGNSGYNLDRVNIYPASYNLENLISVGSTNQFDNLSHFSNYSENSIHLGAPGEEIYSTRSKKTMQTKRIFINYSSAFFNETGTSMAVPFVSGVAALILSKDQNLNYRQVKEIILSTVDKNNLKVLTKGRLNAFRAISSDINSIAPVPPSYLKIDFSISSAPHLTWQDNSIIETGYEIHRSINTSSFQSIGSLPQDSTSFNDNYMLEEGDIFTYRICAKNSKGSNCSEIAGKVPLNTPTNLTAIKTSERIQISWVDNSQKESGYIIERREGLNSYIEIGRVGSNIESFIDFPPDMGKDYYYRVRAFNNDNYSNYSNEVFTGLSSKDKRCFIATALLGENHPYTKALREFRDRHLLTNRVGRVFVSVYYKISPPIANFVSNKPYIKGALKLVLMPTIFLILHPLILFFLISIFFLLRSARE